MGGVAALILLFFAVRMFLPESQKQIIQEAEVRQKDQKINESQNQPIASPEDQKTVSKTESISSTLLAQNKHLEEKSPEKQIAVTAPEKKTPDDDTSRLKNLSAAKATTA